MVLKYVYVKDCAILVLLSKSHHSLLCMLCPPNNDGVSCPLPLPRPVIAPFSWHWIQRDSSRQLHLSVPVET